MYKVMLLDDEPWELKGLKTMLPWEDYGFAVVSAFSNPLEALDCLKRSHFDVLVSDIRMPGLDGISLMKTIRSFDSDLEIIFVSGFAEFEYAREALRNGAYDYLLKPVDLDTAPSLLLRLKNRLDEKKHQHYLRLMDKIADGNLSFVELFPCLTDNSICYSAMGSPELSLHPEVVSQKNNFSILSIPYGRDCVLYFFAWNDPVPLDSFLRQQFPDHWFGISLSLTGSDLFLPDGPNRLMRQAFSAYHSTFFLYPPGLYLYNKTDNHALHMITQQFQTLYVNKKSEELSAFAENLPQTLYSISININGMVRLWNQLMMLLTDSELYEESCLLSAEHMLEHYSDIRQLSQKLLLLLESRSLSESYQTNDEGKDIYRSMIQYVNEHFREPITLQDVADCAHINFTYASKLFKKYTNTNYSKYLTELRMKSACSLLSETDKTIEEICFEIGYRDYFYFNKTFKKHTGFTPLQYRRKETCVL